MYVCTEIHRDRVHRFMIPSHTEVTRGKVIPPKAIKENQNILHSLEADKDPRLGWHIQQTSEECIGNETD